MKKNKRRLSLMLALAMAAMMLLSACTAVQISGNLSLNSDGTGERTITGQIAKQDLQDGYGSAYYYFKQHGADLENYIKEVYTTNVPGSEEWLTVAVDDSAEDFETVTLTFAFESADDYTAKLSSLAYDETAAAAFAAPEFGQDENGNLTYTEATGVMTAIFKSLQTTMMADENMFDINCTKDGEALNDGSADLQSLTDNGVELIKPENGTAMTIQIDGGEVVAMTEANGAFAYGAAPAGGETETTCVLHYTFDDTLANSGTEADNDLTYGAGSTEGGPVYEEGLEGKAIKLDGATYLASPNKDYNYDEMTISFDYRMDEYTATDSGANMIIVPAGLGALGAGVIDVEFVKDPDAEGIQLLGKMNSSDWQTQDKLYSDGYLMEAHIGEWHNYTLVYQNEYDDSGEINDAFVYMYIDGKLASKARLSVAAGLTYSLGLYDDTADCGGFNVGGYYEAETVKRACTGALDNLMVFNGALSEEEVQTLCYTTPVEKEYDPTVVDTVEGDAVTDDAAADDTAATPETDNTESGNNTAVVVVVVLVIAAVVVAGVVVSRKKKISKTLSVEGKDKIMKKLEKGFAAMAILATVSFATCGQNTTSNGAANQADVVEEVGKMLTLTAVKDAQNTIVNDAGMNGTGGRIHLHSNQKEDMYKSQDSEFVFDIGHIEKLGEMYLWNYNAADDTASGIKEVAVSVSEDNETYSEPVTYTLAQATGEEEMAATNLEDGSAVDFAGKSARYVKLEAKSNYGGDGYGLSEVRLFRYKQPIVEGESISASPLERYINDKWSAEPEHYNFVNGAGLSDFNAAEATHDNNPAHMYAQDASAFEFTVDLKGEYPVSKVVLWNYNDPEHLDWGLKEFKLKVSDDYSIWKTVGTYTVAQGDGSDAMAPSLTIDLEEPVQAHYMQLEVISNYGGEMVGLSEVSAFLGAGWYCDAVPDYTALFSRYEGWAGADGIYTVNLDGKDYDYDRDESEQKTFFIFSDTIVSDVDPVTKIRSDFSMPNNTSAMLTGKKADCKNITFRWPEKEESTASIVPTNPIPATKAGKNIYYWLGDTFVIGEHVYVYSLRIDSVNTVFGFDQIGVDLARYDIVDGEVDYDSLTIIDDGNMRLCDVSDVNAKWYMGGAVYQSTEDAGVMDPDGWVYVYGYQDVANVGRELVVSRVKPEDIEDFSKYEYLDANDEWVNTPPKLFKALAHEVAPECSVTQIQDGENKGKFLFVNTHITNSPTLKASMAEKPYEVFENKTTIYTHDDCLTTLGKGNNSYNAKAHPALSGKNEVIISYNVNGDDAFKYADIYRPRFLRLAMVAERK